MVQLGLFTPEAPAVGDRGTWRRVKVSDLAARALRDRHYSTKRPGGATVGPPGRRLVLVTDTQDALWITHHPDPRLVLDKVDAWRCSAFRNEGPRLSSELIREAMARTLEEWPDHLPTAGWLTYVEPGKLASRNPGYCFLMAGWVRDRSWTDRTGRLIRLRAEGP